MNSDNLQRQWEQLPELLSGHVLLTVLALLCGILISVPLGIYSARRPRWRQAALLVASVIQTIPGLAVLAIMVPLLARIGFWPAFLALILYSILPILRNTITGLRGVADQYLEAALGVGMTWRQVLLRVELPLAMPVILAGIRTATTWTVGLATLSTPVGFASLGNYIFRGLQLQNYTAVLFGCVAAGGLAILLDQLLHLVEYGASSRRRWALRSGLAGIAVVGLGGLLPLIPSSTLDSNFPGPRIDDSEREASTAAPRGSIVFGAKPFTEQYILAELLKQAASEAGYTTTVKSNMGSTILFDALRQNQIDAYVDYTGTIWSTVMNREEILSREQTLIEVADYLLREHGIVTLGSLGFENAYCLAMRADQAEELGIETIGDLAARANGLTIGGDYEFFDRQEWQTVRNRYQLSFAREKGMDPSLMYEAVRAKQVDVISAYSTDGRLISYDLRVLRDPRGALPPYDAILMLSPEAAKKRPLVRALWPFINAISNEEMREANRRADEDKEAPETIADELMDDV